MESKLHNFGLVLPDFVRNFVKGKRLKPVVSGIDGHTDLAMLHTGAVKHIARDASFHKSYYFKNATHHIGEIIKPVFLSVNIPRAWWAAHLLAEMMLDRVLIKAEPIMIDKFYHDLETSSTQTITQYLSLCDVHDHEVFFGRLNRFNELRYLKHYVNDDAMVFSVSRVYMYAGVSPEWSDKQTQAIIPLMSAVECAVTEYLPGLKEEMA
jgi:hypothetical protein